jgi:AcrR family transcriptional regulator
VPRSSARTRKNILDAGYTLFRRKGFTRVSMDDIAAAARLTKRTLYYHFKSKDELLTAVFAAQHELAFAAFRTFGDQLVGSPDAIIDTMFRDLAVWADTPRWAGSGFTNSPTFVVTRRVPSPEGTKLCSNSISLKCSIARMYLSRARGRARYGCYRKAQYR